MKDYLRMLEEKITKVIPASIHLRPLGINGNNLIDQPNFMIHIRHAH